VNVRETPGSSIQETRMSDRRKEPRSLGDVPYVTGVPPWCGHVLFVGARGPSSCGGVRREKAQGSRAVAPGAAVE